MEVVQVVERPVREVLPLNREFGDAVIEDRRMDCAVDQVVVTWGLQPKLIKLSVKVKWRITEINLFEIAVLFLMLEELFDAAFDLPTRVVPSAFSWVVVQGLDAEPLGLDWVCSYLLV